jgi:hypothetical protein
MRGASMAISGWLLRVGGRRGDIEECASCRDVIGKAGVETDNGAPGLRRPCCYAVFVLDPDRNNIEAVFRGD